MAVTVPAQALLVDLINTWYLPDDDDVLCDDRAIQWVVARAGAGDSEAVTGPLDAVALQRLRDLREGLRHLGMSNNGLVADPVTVERARAAVSAAPLQVRLGDADDPPTLAARTGSDPAQQLLARVTAAYLNERAAGRWDRVKACSSPDCRYAFVDSSRNRSRRWCSMSGCGNVAKSRAWRARREPR